MLVNTILYFVPIVRLAHRFTTNSPTGIRFHSERDIVCVAKTVDVGSHTLLVRISIFRLPVGVPVFVNLYKTIQLRLLTAGVND